jgi:hypothetical protein
MQRMCVKCQKADNPLGRLRFKKSRVDGRIYCENCDPESTGAPAMAPSVFDSNTSAGFVVIGCPDCAGGTHRPHQKPCVSCSGYGSVRIQANFLNVYRPRATSAPEILTEQAPPAQ